MAKEELQRQLTAALQQEDWDAARALRGQLMADHPDSDEAAEAAYRQGLDALFCLRDLATAVALFEDASKRRHPHWSAAARISLALCYAQQKRTQKALFELRKVALTPEPTANTVAALVWMERLLAQQGDAAEAQKARTLRIGHLRAMLAPAFLPPLSLADRGATLYQLGCALIDQGERPEGRRVLEEARALGPQVLAPEVVRGIAEALKG